MSNNLVERLRNMKLNSCDEAADEIERLRAEIDYIKDKIKDQRRVEVMKNEGTKRSYHDLEIETADIPKTSIFDLPYGLEVTCTRTGGWQFWDRCCVREESNGLIAGEYDTNWLRLTVGDTVIVDSHPQQRQNERLRALLRECRLLPVAWSEQDRTLKLFNEIDKELKDEDNEA